LKALFCARFLRKNPKIVCGAGLIPLIKSIFL
jgi:hypothetical protein